VAMSLVYLVVNDLLRKHLTTTGGDVPTVKRFKQTIITEIKRRFNPDGSDIVTKVTILSSVLDPRYLQQKFLNEDRGSIQHHHHCLLNLTLLLLPSVKPVNNSRSLIFV